MKNLLKKFIVCFLMFSFSTASAGQEAADKNTENPYLWKPKITSVTVFKNGLGFFLREGQVQLREGWCVSGAVPPASFGTLAIFSHNSDQAVDIVGSGSGEVVEFDGTDAPRDSQTKRTRLENCKFLKLQLFYKEQKSDRNAVGRLVSVGSDYVILEAENNNFAVPLADITKLAVLEKPLRIHVASDDKKAINKTTLGMAYLRKGITWIPEYTLKLLDEDTAELTLRGTLVNEAEDLVHCDMQFVVGVPHFIHTDYLAPVSVGQIIRTIGTAVAPPQVATQMMNRAAIAVDNAIRSNQFDVLNQPVVSGGRDLRDSTGNLPQLEASGATDYTVYERKDITLRVGEKAIVTLFVKKIKYSHLYRWSPPKEIEHYIVLNNDTDSAFTTGPCLVISDNRALSEDLLKYVPKGGKGELPVTTAINIAHDQKEMETNRVLKEYQPSPGFYVDLVTLDGELKLRNFDKKHSEIDVELNLQGKPLSASDEGGIYLDTEKLKILERIGTIRWKIVLKSGETKNLTYKVERYVPSL